MLTYPVVTTIHFQHSGNQWRVISTNEGVTQGDPASNFFFDAVYCQILALVVASLPTIEDQIYAIHDDVTITGPDPKLLLRLLKDSSDALARAKLRVKATKCELLVPPNAPHGSYSHAYGLIAQASGPTGPRICQLIDGCNGSVRIVGAHVGDENSSIAYLHKKWLDTKALIEAVMQHVSRQSPRAAVALLRYCAQPKLLFRLTCHRPNLTRKIAEDYDTEICQAVRSIVGANVDRDMIICSYGLGFIDYPAALEILYDRFLRETDTAATRRSPFERRNGLSETDQLVELQTQKNLTVINNFPQLKSRMSAFGSAATSSVSWLSSFAPVGFQADLADVYGMLRVMLLAEPISTAKCYCDKEDPGNGSFTEHVLTCASLRYESLPAQCGHRSHAQFVWSIRHHVCR
jgi:hypothetical protein